PPYGPNMYQDQAAGIQMDMPAIFALVLWKYDPVTFTWTSINSWTNETWWGEGAPLCFRYADYDAIDGEQFAIELYIYGPWWYDGTSPRDGEEVFGYTIDDGSRDWQTDNAQHVWFFTDNALEDLDMGYPDGDGVIEFAWGNCVEDPEYQLPIY
ncbi:MAG: hypothetical protein DRI83_09775, partial [Bacteroidetes bacterium]